MKINLKYVILAVDWLILSTYALFVIFYNPPPLGLVIGFVIGFTLLLVLDDFFYEPLDILKGYLIELQNGSGKMPSISITEYQELIGLIDSYANRISQECDDSKAESSKLWKLAHTDTLTKACNRLMLDHDISHLVDTIGSSRLDICFAMIDGNGFKYINDTYGHSAGDKALQHITDTITSVIRAGDKVYRIGGDEFAVLFIDTTLKESVQVLERCSTEIMQKRIPEINDNISVSIGVSCITGPFTNVDILRLKQTADNYLYAAKTLTNTEIDGTFAAAIPAKLGDK